MTQSEEAALVREIGNLARFGGGAGARLAAKRLPTEEHRSEITIRLSADQLRVGVREVLQSIGTPTDEFAFENNSECSSAIVGSGIQNLNPTIVHVDVNPVSQDVTHVSIRALAKEGLVKQQSAHGAVERIEALLSNWYAEQIVGREPR